MRILAYFLIVINIGLLIFYLFLDNKSPDNKVPIYDNVDSITLLSEKNNLYANNKPSKKYIKPVQLPTQKKEILNNKKISNNNSDESIGINGNKNTKKTIKLTDETPGAVETVSIGCWTIGPFDRYKNLKLYQNKIKQQSIKTRVRNISNKYGGSYRVYIRAKNSKSANNIGAKLRKQKVTDFYIIKNGVNKNYISLGLFSIHNNALNKAKIVKRLGYNPIIDTIHQTKTIYWLDYKAVEQADNLPLTIKNIKTKCNF
ncbi:MAG: hypothetical protein DRQ51_08050 [Gammaproteobacteria bacterium]|nr:MAG: hypothetical protein DRQ51_08050 [Gammaproteobacteria bacterium]